MKNKAKNPFIVGLQDKEDKNTARALRTESMKMALASAQEGEDSIFMLNNRNGKKIQALTENMTIDKDHAGICLVYTGTTYGWVLRESL